MDIEEIYSLIPGIQCKGLCHTYCGVIPLEPVEYDRLTVKPETITILGHIGLKPKKGAVCPLLTADNRCSDYAHRPAICRLWGVTRGMLCPHGCEPERIVEERESFALLDLVRGLNP